MQSYYIDNNCASLNNSLVQLVKKKKTYTTNRTASHLKSFYGELLQSIGNEGSRIIAQRIKILTTILTAKKQQTTNMKSERIFFHVLNNSLNRTAVRFPKPFRGELEKKSWT